MPYLFVQVYDIRKQGRGRQMSFMFSPDDVGGLDAEFIEQNITDNPAEAWRTLNGDDGAHRSRRSPTTATRTRRGPGGNWNRDDSYDSIVSSSYG